MDISIPLTCAFIAFFFLHRRHVKKLRLEDANDKHKSLDFGLDDMPSGRVKKGSTANGSSPMAEKSSRHAAHGVSMDLTLSSPYLLPPGLNGSHESIHSLSRSLHGEDDKYRTVAGFTAGDSSSMRSYSPSFRRGADDASTHTSPSAKYPYGDDMNQNLLKNAQRMSRSPPIIQTDPAESDLGQASNRSPSNSEYIAFSPSRGQLAVPTAVTNFDDLSVGNDNEKEPSVLRKSNNYLGALIHRGDASSPDNQGEHNTQAEKRNPLPSDSEKKEAMPDATSKAFEFKLEAHPDHNVPSAQTPRISLPLEDDKSDYGDEPTPFKHVTPQVQVQKPETAPVNRPPSTHETYDSYYDGGYQVDTRRLTMGIRPLPPEDPSENPEQRANRIRSFYKEYFDESKPQGDYYEDYDTTAYSAYDPFGQGAPRPFAQPEGRRAMTPPPRMPPLPAQYRQRNPDIGPPASASHSVATSVSSGPRAYSSASGRLASRAPKKPLPPPSPLHVLPTPHKLKDDSFLPIDFAPGMNAHDRRYGRPETPQGGLKPYMLTVPAHVPLASSYDDLAILPSP